MLLKSILRFVATGIILFVLNYLLYNSISFTPYISLTKTYVFVVCLSIFVLFLIYLIAKEFPDFVGYSFMLLTLVKMVLTVFFLWTFLKTDMPEKFKHLLSFMIPYFVFLFLETKEAISLNSNS